MSDDVVDLDALRAARAEARGTRPRVSLGGEIFELVPEVPIGMIDAMVARRLSEAVGLLLVDKTQTQRFVDRASFDDLTAILKAVYRFGGGLGESSASPPSSPSTGKRSRPTSNASTRSTSVKPAGVRRR